MIDYEAWGKVAKSIHNSHFLQGILDFLIFKDPLKVHASELDLYCGWYIHTHNNGETCVAEIMDVDTSKSTIDIRCDEQIYRAPFNWHQQSVMVYEDRRRCELDIR